MQLLQAVRDHKQSCTHSGGLDYMLLAKLLGDLGYLIQKHAPEVVCHCKFKQKSHKCLEKLAHTYLLCLSPLHPHRQVCPLSTNLLHPCLADLQIKKLKSSRCSGTCPSPRDNGDSAETNVRRCAVGRLDSRAAFERAV